MSIAHDVLDSPIHRAKLRRPPVGDRLVARPRLTSSLDRSLQVPLTIVAAPAGFGKTTLLTEWAEQQTIPVAWLTMDAEDGDLARFVPYLAAAIGTVRPEVGGDLQTLWRESPANAAVDIGAVLADRLLDAAGELVIIIDDAHLGASSDVTRVLRGMLQLAPPHVHLILGTRTDPALPLGRLRLHGQLHEIRASDLRFTDDEVRALLPVLPATVNVPDLVAVLQRKTEGWVVALRLAALALPTEQDPEHTANRLASDEHLMDILIEEVLAKQSAETQDFLLRTAVVDRICPSLADALLDPSTAVNSEAMLDSLPRVGLFIEAEAEDGAWFRYHPIFHRLLRHQLGLHLAPDDLARLHARASDWFEANGRLNEAVRHRLLAGDAPGTADLVERLVHPLLNREDWRRLDGWLRLLPDSLLASRPVLLLARAWISHFSGRLVPVRAIVAEVESLLAASTVEAATEETLRAECEVLTLISMEPIDADPPAARARAQAAVARISSAHRLAHGLALYALGCALQTCGRTAEAVSMLTAAVKRDEEHVDAGLTRSLIGLIFVHRQAGNFDACAAAARHTLTLADREGLPVAQGWAHWSLGWIAYERDALDEASAHLAAIVADHRRRHLTCVGEASFGLALIAQARGNPAEADAALQRLRAIVLENNALEYLPWLSGFEANLALMRGDTEAASNWLNAERATIGDCSLHVSAHPFLVAIKTRLAQNTAESLKQAGRDLTELRTFAETRHYTAALVQILALDALVLEAQGHLPEAMERLSQSVKLGRPGGFRRTYRDLGPSWDRLLARREGEGWAASPTGAEPQAAPMEPGAAMLDVLTLREADVLLALARRHSYREIAAELFVSLETVKSHTSNIYGKLGVATRREAITRAQRLGWTPPD